MTECYYDVIHYASQIGRLDIVSLALVAVGLFVLFKSPAMARAEARDAAEKVAYRVTKDYLESPTGSLSLEAIIKEQATEETRRFLSDKDKGTSVKEDL